MTSPSSNEVSAQLRQTRDALKQPVASKSDLVALLGPPLALVCLLPPLSSAQYSKQAQFDGSRSTEAKEVFLGRLLGSLQAVVLEAAGSWWDVLSEINEGGRDDDLLALLDAWFCPTRREGSSGQAAVAVAMSGLQVLLSTPPSPSSSTPKLAFIVPTLSRLLSNYPVTQVYAHLTSQAGPIGPWSSKETIAWESFVRCLVSLPGKLMNLTQGGTLYPVPAELDSPSVFRSLAIGVDEILWSRKDSQPGVGPLGFLVALLVRQGYASPSSISALSTALEYPANLFSVLLPRFLPRYDSSLSYATSWSRVLLDGATFSDQARLAESLLRHLLLGISTDSSVEAQCARAGQALQVLMGSSEPSLVEKVLLGVEAISLTGGEGSVESRAKMGVFWAGKKEKDEKALATLLFKVLDLWTDIQFIKFSLIAKHTYILTLFLLLLRSFPPQALALQRVASSPQFLNGLMHYLSHPDRSIRYLGMLGAEVVSELTVPPGAKKLDFGLWEGEEGHKILARRLRGLKMDWAAVDAVTDPSLGWQKTSTVATTPPHMPSLEPSVEAPPSSPKERKKARSKKPSTKIVVLSDSDDSLTGYHSSSSVSSTRSSSPTPSDLEEYVTDPTLYNAKKKKVPRPVYLSQLGELLGSRDDPEKLETGLKWGESLVRRKRGFGLELEENAVYIALMLAGLNDNFELDDFDNRKQGIMNALVACSPRKTAPALIEQYFHNQYSLQQRSAILTALAMGAREAAGMSTLATPTTASVDWPSKRLPPNLHQRYVSTTDGTPRAALGRVTPPCQIEHVASELSSMAIECSREDAESKIGEFQREKQVRVKRFAKAKPTAQVTSVPSAAELGIPEFKDVAAEFFIMPLINRFWLHYEEEDAKATRTSSSYTSTGAGMILSALALSKLLATMSVLVHAARHSPFFLTVIAPETLRLAMTTAGRLAASKRDSVDDGEVSVLGGALELSIVALDASRDLDDGRTLMVDHAGLILTVSEWGELVFAQTEKGERVLGEGGEAEGRVRRASAGLCVLVAGIRERWIRLVGFGS